MYILYIRKYRVAKIWKETFMVPSKLLLQHLPRETAENYYTFSVNLSDQLEAGIFFKAGGLASFSVVFCFSIPLIKVLANTDISLYVRHSSLCLYDTLRYTLRTLDLCDHGRNSRQVEAPSVAGS